MHLENQNFNGSNQLRMILSHHGDERTVHEKLEEFQTCNFFFLCETKREGLT